MRTFEDDAGGSWDVAVSSGSYGAQILIFARRQGRELRSFELEVIGHFDAEQTLQRMTDDELRQTLGRSQPLE